MKSNKFIPFYKPDIGPREISEVTDTLKSGWLTLGPKTKKFESETAKYLGAKNTVAVSSCTAGLHLSLSALEIGPGDEVITTSLTFPATVNVIEHVGAKVVFADIKRDSYNLDSKDIIKKITKKTKAIIPVHYSGNADGLSEIYEIAKEYKLYVIEDAAHAMGASYKGRKIGSSEGIASFSFYATKNMTTGEGGLVSLKDDELAEKIRVLSLHGISKDVWKRYSKKGSWKYEVNYPGYKYNFTDIQAALGLVQLQRLDSLNQRRRHLADLYNKLLCNVKGIKIPYFPDEGKPIWHLYVIEVDEKEAGISRDIFIEKLLEKSIGTSVHFIPQHIQPYYSKKYHLKATDLPVCYEVYNRIVSLPLYTKMSDKDVATVAEAIRDIVRR